MRSSLFIFLILFSSFCKSQDKGYVKTESMYYIPIVTSEFEKMNFKKIKEEYLKLHPAQNPEATAYSYSYDEIFEDKIIYYIYYEIKKGIIRGGTEMTFYNNSPFMIKKEFYANGNIKEKGLYIVKGDFYKGIWYYYNEKGDLIHSIDNDVFFKYTWENLTAFIKENNIVLPLGRPWGKNSWASINSHPPKPFPESSAKPNGPVTIASQPFWTITWRKPKESLNDYTEVSLDGTTGKMGYRKKYTVAEGPGDEGKEEIEYFNLPKDKK